MHNYYHRLLQQVVFINKNYTRVICFVMCMHILRNKFSFRTSKNPCPFREKLSTLCYAITQCVKKDVPFRELMKFLSISRNGSER